MISTTPFSDYLPGGKPIVGVWLRSKWYALTLTIHDEVTEVEFPDEGRYEELGSPYVDHVPNPRHVVAWAKRMGYQVDDLALELMVGRWELEAGKRYADMLGDT